MTDVFDIDTYLRTILEPKHGKLGLVQRHKLCYGVLRGGISKTGESPFNGRVVAWPLGPVFVDLWEQPDCDGDANNIPPALRALVEDVASRLGGLSGKKLAMRTHGLMEWKLARRGLASKERGDHEITRAMIRSVTSHGVAETIQKLKANGKLGDYVHVEDDGTIMLRSRTLRDGYRNGLRVQGALRKEWER
jgi:uncharacterized phage-associated protein